MMLLSLPILYCVDMAKGRRDAEVYEDGLSGGGVALTADEGQGNDN